MQPVDLLQLLSRETTLTHRANTRGGEWAGPCPLCNAGVDRFRVQPNAGNAGLWWCRVCSEDDRWHDAIDYIRKRDNVGFVEAKQRLGMASNDTRQNTRKPSQAAGSPPTNSAPPDDDWQSAARQMVHDCTGLLWDKDGAAALDYLHGRGLDDNTILSFELGYLPAGLRAHGYIDTVNCITIPWQDDRNIWAVKMRRSDKDKYKQVTGGRAGLFGVQFMSGQRDVFVTEGEFDCMILHQHVSHFADVVTTGSATSKLPERWLPALMTAKNIWIVTDNDKEGNKAAKYWQDLTGARSKRITPPAHDITDAWRDGVDLRGWAIELLSDAPLPEAIALGGFEATTPARQDGDVYRVQVSTTSAAADLRTAQ